MGDVVEDCLRKKCQTYATALVPEKEIIEIGSKGTYTFKPRKS
jgi:hypothetical protein